MTQTLSIAAVSADQAASASPFTFEVSLLAAPTARSAAAYGGGTWVAVGPTSAASDKAAVSTDGGVTWSLVSLPQSAYWNDITYGGGVFIAVSGSPLSSGTIAAVSSDSGVTWTALTTPAHNSWWEIAYGNGHFVLVDSQVADIQVSSDLGVTWTAASSPFVASSLHFGNGAFYAFSGSGSVFLSTNGLTWSTVAMPAGSWATGASDGTATIVALNGLNTSVAVSTDNGVTWATHALPGSGVWGNAAWNGSFFVAVSSGTATAATSPDGITWTLLTLPLAQYFIEAGGGGFVAFGSTSGFTVSPDGTTWSLGSMATTAASATWTVSGSGTNPAPASEFAGVYPTGTVTFAPGATTAPISISVVADTATHPDLGFTVTLSAPTGATIAVATALGTILAFTLALPTPPPKPPAFSDEDFHQAMLRLLPRGPVWRTDPTSNLSALLLGLAPTYTRSTTSAAQLLIDTNPATTQNLLAEWEASLGLPDPCMGVNPPLEQRQAAVRAKFGARGSLSVPFIIAMAATLGFTITITEAFTAYTVGQPIGQPINGAAWAFAWQVTCPTWSYWRFHVGANTCGQPLAYWPSSTLICEIQGLAPAHTVLLFDLAGFLFPPGKMAGPL
jgi:uncharacterized protein YmfQ (DUF2313 family)